MNANEGILGNINKYFKTLIPYETQKKWEILVNFYHQTR